MSLKNPVSPSESRVSLLRCLRQPRQERGERRVGEILDAAASLVAEVGPSGLTVHALAERAGTSKGSLYHFFPDLPSVLRALADRHGQAMEASTRAVIEDRTIDWAALTAEDAVDRFLAPLAYLERHPDLLALARTPLMVDERTRRLAPLCELADHVIALRQPALDARARAIRASTMVAVVDGVVGYTLRASDLGARELILELGRVLVGYLRAVEEPRDRSTDRML